jgi:hypothetical protein
MKRVCQQGLAEAGKPKKASTPKAAIGTLRKPSGQENPGS